MIIRKGLKPRAVAVPRTIGAVISFPERVWEKGFVSGKWYSRPVTAQDIVARRAVAKQLGCTISGSA